ncbi:hypothetical protein GCM10023340_08710 [Nocardioides marinquilinus]|uniref:Bacterial Ig-like domain-containing protein n=1 Tax=Nocardioides marinquilinus TaxID=1210400 RepID=A0ABP9PAC4_9ACTN
MSRTRRHRLGARLAVLGLLAALAAATGLPTSPATAAENAGAAAGSRPTSWNDGKHDQDTILDCWTQEPAVGVSADAGWGSLDGEVPEVGEIFYVRGYIGSVALPCLGRTGVLPEVVPPAGLEFADEEMPIYWSLAPIGAPQWSTRQLSFAHGAHGGYLIGTPDGKPWELRQGQVLEIQLPVRATRPMKGPATQQPECQDRVDGDAPCPVAVSGDHFQFAYTLTGSGSDRQYVIPYVGLFVAERPAPPAPVGSTTAARYQVSARAAGKAVVTVTSRKPATGAVVVRDGARTIGRGTVGTSGRVTVRLPRLARGVHRLSVRYAGSRTVKPSTSVVTRVRVG